MTSLAQKTLTGVIWNLLQQFASRGITVLVTLMLAYFLAPEDFGLVAMMAVFLAIGNSLMDSGFRQALIRMKEAKPIDFNTGFFANLLLGLLAYVLLFASAPLIAEFYAQPQLVELIRITAMTVIINAFQVGHVAKLSREMNFKAQFKAVLPASALSAVVAMTMAYFGFGVWALVGQMLASAFFITLFLSLQCHWKPGREVSLESLSSMYNFGYKLFLAGLLDIVFRNLYVIVIAKLFTASHAGLYYFADRIREIVIYQLVTSIQQVTFPALASFQDDNDRLKDGYRNVILVTTFVLFPVIILMAVMAEPLFHLLLHEKWWPAATYLELMCMASLLIPLHAINLNILQVKGRSDLSLLVELTKKLLQTIILVFSINFGIIGILYGQIISSSISFLINGYFSKRLIGYSILNQVKDFMPNMILSLVIGLFIIFLQKIFAWNELVTVLALVPFGAALYIWASIILKLKGMVLFRKLIKNQNTQKAA
ncbi:capsular polysaccharide repeat unit transporter [Methylophaga lonarensis MPL]|uniref:Capsular polysaccharide repeat unit transporter n=1 Tax=Methylophaga lonarensis MPL TaxID=1286106 RepID=M7PN62_9GAMM|nr:lipopolysaccharide biosynthesis protein [Methylophaga lonarensis]EMR11904.1 capsular polysaccharide repeat unit transporter [Methylophaga lonarensis MPL]